MIRAEYDSEADALSIDLFDADRSDGAGAALASPDRPIRLEVGAPARAGDLDT